MRQNDNGRPVAGESPDHATPIRWRWYHFYFLLALFDVVVIIASLTMYHQTLVSYERALAGLNELDAKQTWMGKLKLTVIALNAPGNDVFDTRDVPAERRKFDEMRTRFRLLLHRAEEFDTPMPEVEDHVDKMIANEEQIFRIMAGISSPSSDDAANREALDTATRAMASMDRHQARAVRAISDIEQKLQNRQSTLLAEYGRQLQKSADAEKYFFVTVLLILAGVFWYGRKLQNMHDRMLENQQRAITERHERLASVGEVCSAVSHGIRNPLAAITSSAQLGLEFGTLDDATRLRLKDVLSESQRLNRRISRLLEYARGGASMAIPFDVANAVRMAVHEMKTNMETRRLQLETEISDQPLMVEGNPDELTQCVIELISNSMDHVTPGGRISVSCRRNGKRGRAEICVGDNGPGIPEEIRQNIFDLFFTTKAQGNGIGLASVKRTVESHGGEITVGTNADGGALFCASLPLGRR